MKQIILAALLFASPALVQGTQPSPSAAGQGSTSSTEKPTPATAAALAAMHRTCAADFKARCPNMAAGSAELQACVQAHFSELTQPCQSSIMDAISAQPSGG